MKKKLNIITLALVVTFGAIQNQATAMKTTERQVWQLFIDDYWIENTSGITTTLHQPVKYANNPVISGDLPWATNPYCFGSVIYDEENAVFKLWYMSYNYGYPLEDRTFVLYATSVDGVSWDRPALGIHEFNGDRENNIVLSNYGHHDLYSPSVIKDSGDPDPERRYKMIWSDFPHGPEPYQDDGMCVAFSDDGIHWMRYKDNPVLSHMKHENAISDVLSVMVDRSTGKYVTHAKGWANPWPEFRQIVRTESEDFVNWSEPQVVLSHAHDLSDPQSYGMSVSKYESVYLGLMPSYKDPGNETIDIQLTVSHDNRRWSRVADMATFLPLGPEGAWDDGMLFAAPMIEHENRILILYGGWDGNHDAKERRAGIGLATLRKDGFVSLDASENEGILTTRLMRNTHGQLFINADASNGLIRVEVIGPNGRPLPGYSARDSIGIRVDSVHAPVTWKSGAVLPKTTHPIQLRFHLKNASLYSFSAGPDLKRIENFQNPLTE